MVAYQEKFEALKGKIEEAANSVGDKLQDVMLETPSGSAEKSGGVGFSKTGKITLGAAGVLGLGMVFTAGGKSDIKNDLKKEVEGAKGSGTFSFKPIKRILQRGVGLALTILSLDALAHGEKSILGKHTAKLLHDRAQAPSSEIYK